MTAPASPTCSRRLLMLAAGLALAAPATQALASSGEKKKGGGLSFVQMPPVTATIVRRNGRNGVLSVETGLDTANEAMRTLVSASVPRLRDAYAQVLQAYAAMLGPDVPPKIDYLAVELQRATDRVLGRKGARLLLGTVMVS